MAEEWRPLDWIANGVFEVSSLGRVRHRKTKRIRALRPRSGYWRIGLKRKVYAAHRLVAMAFIPNPDGKPSINHINGDKRDNRVENLEWCTHLENMQHASRGGRMVAMKGEENPASKLTGRDVVAIRRMYATSGKTQKQIGQMFGVSQRMVCLITRREKWTHV